MRTDHRYSDFVLELDWKAQKPEKWDSGIYFRCDLPPEGKPWPSRYQANLLQGQEGNVGGLAGATSKGLAKPGEWNTLEINCRGTSYRVTHNGVVIVNATEDEFPELKDRQLRGFLGLQNHSEHVWFRNVRVGPPQP